MVSTLEGELFVRGGHLPGGKDKKRECEVWYDRNKPFVCMKSLKETYYFV